MPTPRIGANIVNINQGDWSMSNKYYSAAATGAQGYNGAEEIWQRPKIDLYDNSIDIDYDYLEIILDELDLRSEFLSEDASQFVEDMRNRFLEYGYDTYVSGRQWGWLLDLFMRHVSIRRRKEIQQELAAKKDTDNRDDVP
jgi:hypothetical protein